MGKNNPGLTTDDVRAYINDVVSRNKLLQDEEFSEDRIRLALELACDDFNNIPIQTNFSVERFPARAILLLGAVAHLYGGERFAMARNNLTYSDAGVNVNDQDKAGIYAELSNQAKAEFEQKAKQWKREYNIKKGWGGFGSEYAGYYRTR